MSTMMLFPSYYKRATNAEHNCDQLAWKMFIQAFCRGLNILAVDGIEIETREAKTAGKAIIAGVLLKLVAAS